MKLLASPLYAVSDEWEHNGYDDSDFYRTMYDPMKDEIRKVQTFTTRCGCGYYAVVTEEHAAKHNLGGYIHHDRNPVTGNYDVPSGRMVPLPVTSFVPPADVPARVWQRAEQLLADRIFNLIRSAEHREVLEPENAKQGDWLRLTEDHKSRKAGCTLKAGTRIRVNSCTAFGTFYAKGYNQPGRGNRSVVGTVAGNVAQLVRVPLAKCRLDREPEADDSLRARAVELAANRRFEQAWGRVF